MKVDNRTAEGAARQSDQACLRGRKVARVSTIPFFVISQLKGQIEHLRDQGMEVVVISSPGEELVGWDMGTGLHFEATEIPRDFAPLRDLVALWSLIRMVRRYRFDIVHSTTPKAGLLMAVAAFVCRVPVRLHTYTGQRWVTLSGALRWVTRWSDRLIALLNTRCYADSESQRAFLVAQGVVPDGKLSVIGKGSLAGVDLRRFDRQRWRAEGAKVRVALRISPNARVVLFVGRVTRDKGVGELYEAFARLLAEGLDAHLILVGPVDRDYEASLRGSAGEQGEQVHFVGYTGCPERYLATADVLCLPSYREGFGTVVIEAAAMGVPTVGTDITGLRDAIVDGETGMLVPVRDVSALTDTLGKLLRDPARLRTMGGAARARCARDFDADIVNAMLGDEYRRLLAERAC